MDDNKKKSGYERLLEARSLIESNGIPLDGPPFDKLIEDIKNASLNILDTETFNSWLIQWKKENIK